MLRETYWIACPTEPQFSGASPENILSLVEYPQEITELSPFYTSSMVSSVPRPMLGAEITEEEFVSGLGFCLARE